MNDDYVIYWHQQYNSIVVIESLNMIERHTGRELFDDIINRLSNKQNLKSFYKNPKSADDFKALMQNLIIAVKTKGFIPILHFEMHGNENGLQLENGDFIEWQKIVTYFREINIFLKNQLLVTLAACKGAYIQQYISFEEPSPVMCVIASAEVVYSDVLIDDFTRLYEGILNGNPPQTCIDSINIQNNRFLYKPLHCEVIFQLLVEIGKMNGIPQNKINNIRKIYLMRS